MNPGMNNISNRSNSNDGICPYLGFIDDRLTAMAYPSQQNFCHRCVPTNVPKLQNQRELCLSQNHVRCPIFLSKKNQPMPFGMSSDEKIFIAGGRRGVKLPFILLVTLIGILAIAFFTWNIYGASLLSFLHLQIGQLPITQTGQDQVTETLAFIMTSTQTPTPTETPFPTATITLTPTEIPLHVVETVINSDLNLLIHEVHAGETFTTIADKFQTTPEAIQAINANGTTLKSNTLIVVPVGKTEVTGLPAFSIQMITEQEVSLSDLAAANSVSIDDLAKYNQLPIAYMFHAGECVLIPLTEVQP